MELTDVQTDSLSEQRDISQDEVIRRKRYNEHQMLELMKSILEYFRVLPLASQEQFIAESLVTKQTLERRVVQERLTEQQVDGPGINFSSIFEVECHVCAQVVPRSQITVHLVSCLRSQLGEIDFFPRKRGRDENEIPNLSTSSSSPKTPNVKCSMEDSNKCGKAKSNRHVIIEFEGEVLRFCRWAHFQESSPFWNKLSEKNLVTFTNPTNCYTCGESISKGIIITHSSRKVNKVRMECCSWLCFYQRLGLPTKQVVWENATKLGELSGLIPREAQLSEGELNDLDKVNDGNPRSAKKSKKKPATS